MENVLTMTAGFRWDELSTSYFNPQNDARKMAVSKDSVKYVLDLPIINQIRITRSSPAIESIISKIST